MRAGEAVTLVARTRRGPGLPPLPGQAREMSVKRRLTPKRERETPEYLAAHEREVRAQALAPIREALAGHPRCDIHPDSDAITCGWMRAVASVQAALDKEDR